MDNNDRTWMYRRLENGFLTNEYCVGVEAFVAFALSHPECLLNGKLRCPCNQNKCQNKCYLDEHTVKVHLGRYGFVSNYDCWYFHGEQYVRPFYHNVNMDVPTSSYRYPKAVGEVRWAACTAACHDQRWLDRAEKNKSNRSSEPAGPGTGTSKHIAGSKTYSAHYQSLIMQRERQGPDGLFVDEQSKLVNQSMEEAYRDESLNPLDDGTIPDQPSPDEVNSMFKHVVGGPKKGRMYGCGSMASTIYPHDMAPRPRGVGSRSSHDSGHTREDFEAQNRVIEFLRVDLQASQRKNDMLEKKNDMLESRMSSLEDQVRLLVAGLPQEAPVQPQTQSSRRFLYGQGASSRGRSIASSSRPDPYAAESSRGDRFAADSSYHHTSSQVHRYAQQWVSPSQDFGLHGGADRDDDDDDGVYDHDETQTS